MATLMSNQGKHEEAIGLMEKELPVFEKGKHPVAVGTLLSNIGTFRLRQQAFVQAQTNLEKALSHWRRLNYPNHIAATLLNLANVYRETRQLDKAHGSYRECLTLAENLQDKRLQTVAFISVAYLYCFEQNHQEALSFHLKGIKLAYDLGETFWFIHGLVLLARTHFELGNPSAALTLTGGVETFLKDYQLSLLPNYQVEYEQLHQELHDQLETGDLTSMLVKGRSFNLSDVMTFIKDLES